MRNKIKIALVVSLIFLAGCQDFLKSKPTKQLEKDMTSVTKVLNKSADSINNSTKTIDDNVIIVKQHTKDVLAQAPGTVELVAGIEKSADSIALESQKLKDVSLDLSKAGVKLEISGRAIETIVDRAEEAEKSNEKLIEENAKLNENIKSGLNRMLKWIVGGCLIGAGVCAAMALFFGNVKGGLFGAATCIIIMTLAIAVGQYMMYIAIAGILAIIGTLGVLGYQLLVQRRAISDNIWTQEIVKKNLPLDLKEKIYGKGDGKGQAGKIQSKTTQKIVKQIKNKLPKGWGVMKKDKDLFS